MEDKLNAPESVTLVSQVDALREDILVAAKKVISLTKLAGEGADVGAMMANIILSYRHLEDARMRLGKLIDAHEGV